MPPDAKNASAATPKPREAARSREPLTPPIAAQAIENDQPASSIRSWDRTKKLAFRLVAALGIPLALLGGLELALRLAGFGFPSHFFIHTRLNGESIIHDNQKFGWRFFPPRAARTPQPVSLPSPKPAGTCRIFVLGESAAYGDPAPAFGLPRVLEVLLRNRYPDTRFEVVNAAMTAINSNVILPIARDCAREQGDLWVLYIGNNEVVGPYGGGTVFGPQVPSLAFIRASIALKATRIGQLLDRLRRRVARGKSGLPATVSLELFLDQQLRQDDPRMKKVYDHFAQNLTDIVQTGVRSGAKVILSTVASNLKDCPPFASLHRPDLGEAQKAQWEAAYRSGIEAEEGRNLPAALAAYGRAAHIDDSYAELQFRWARTEWLSGDFERARSHFGLARDYDTLRVRADDRLNEIVRQVASNCSTQGVGFVDGNQVLAGKCPHGVTGEEVLFEHVHLNYHGNYWLARSVAAEIENLKPAALAGQRRAGPDWISEEECYAQLGLNDWDRYQTREILRERLEHPPFTAQLDHREQYERVKTQAASLRRDLTPERLAEAVQVCRRAVSLAPQDWVLHQKLGALLEKAGDVPGAVKELQKAVAAVPHYPDAHYDLGLLLETQGRNAEAAAALKLALDLRPDDPPVLNALGRALAAQHQLAEAIRCYERAIRSKPDFGEALVNLRLALNSIGTNATAQARVKQETAGGVDLGVMLQQGEQVNEVIRRNTEILRTNPRDAKAHYQLGEAFRLMGRYAEAQAQYAEAVRDQPDFAEAHCMLGLALAKAGKQSEAMEQFAEALRLKPELGLAHLSMGVALARQQRFQEALRLDPSDTNAQKYLKAARRALGQSE